MGGGTETKVAPAPRPSVAPAKTAAAPKARKFKKKPHVLETTIAMQLLLRRIAERSHYPNGATGKLKTAKVAIAGTEVVALLQEAVQISVIDKDNPVDWKKSKAELAYCLQEVAVLHGQMKDGELKQVDGQLTEALKSFEGIVPKKSWKDAHDAKQIKPLAALNQDENYDLARNAIIAACREVTKFKGSTRSDTDRVNTTTATLPLHFHTASTAAKLVKDRDLRITLHDDMALASKGMGYLDAFIGMAPRIPWNRLYASAFDAENDARVALGLQAEKRVYSGTIDPGEALKTVQNTVVDGRVTGSWSKKVFQNPEQAVLGMAAALDMMFDQQMLAVTRLASDLKEPPKPKQQSFWEKLLEVAVKVALSTVAGALSSYFENAIKMRVDNVFAKKSGLPMGVFELLPKAEQGQWLSDTLKGGDIFRKVTADAAKDGFKEIIKSGGMLIYQMSLGSHTAKTKATEPLNAFTQVQHGALTQQRFEARSMMIRLMGALQQLDLEVLNAMALGISDEVSTKANDAQYDASMNEWQNLKARLTAGDAKAAAIPKGVRKTSDAAPKDLEGKAKRGWDKQVKKNPELATEKMPDIVTRDAAMNNSAVAGAFEIDVYVDAEGSRKNPQRRTSSQLDWTFKSLKLPGAEPVTRTHFRQKDERLSRIPMNKHFNLRFTSYNNETLLKVGVGPDRGLILDGLDFYELRMLKFWAAGETVTYGGTYAYTDRDKESEAPGINLLVKMIERLQYSIRTWRLEK
jgi:hypothetical protein